MLAKYEKLYANKPNKADRIVARFMASDLKNEFNTAYQKYKNDISLTYCDDTGRNLPQIAIDLGFLEFFDFIINDNVPEVRIKWLHAFNSAGLAAIHYASKELPELSAIESITKLLSLGANVDLRTNNSDQFPALKYAIERKIVALVKLFLKNKADIFSPIPGLSNKSLIHFACGIDATRDKEGLEVMMLVLDAMENRAPRVPGDNLLHVAVRLGERKAVEQILNAARINGTLKQMLDAKNSAGDTPLHVAGQNLDSELAELLIRNGANQDIRNKEGYIPLIYALQKGKKAEAWGTILITMFNQPFSIVYTKARGLKDENQDPSYLWLMARNECEVGVFKVLSALDMSRYRKSGQNLLHMAAWGTSDTNDNIDKITYFNKTVGLGINAKTEDSLEYTPLHAAMETATPETVRHLLALGADPKIRDKAGATPLDWLKSRDNKNPHKAEIQAILTSAMQYQPGATGNKENWARGPVSFPAPTPSSLQASTASTPNLNNTHDGIRYPGM